MASAFIRGVALLALIGVSCADDEERRRLGDVCSRDEECASNRCDELVCKAKPPAGFGEFCVHPLECASEVCIAGACAVGIRGDGQACTHDLQCRSEACVGGFCVVRGVDGGDPDAGVDGSALDTVPDSLQLDSQTPDVAVDVASVDVTVDLTITPDAAPGPWRPVPAGTFTMGASPADTCQGFNETQRVVTLTHAYLMSQSEVTQGEFKTLMGYDPSSWTACGSDCPVETVSWHEAVSYCNALSREDNLAECYTCTGDAPDFVCQEATLYQGPEVFSCPGYRLPTEA
ncbi:MAG: SUMF1/EgtB/PvdO family nonheme iron enzyme, partial [Deltaproteobacteria bacterium]|nr:SUMF1/EgtB/PvdO family nonheme iron enzyme [Deltaproteobacteria bacterium]